MSYEQDIISNKTCDIWKMSFADPKISMWMNPHFLSRHQQSNRFCLQKCLNNSVRHFYSIVERTINEFATARSKWVYVRSTFNITKFAKRVLLSSDCCQAPPPWWACQACRLPGNQSCHPRWGNLIVRHRTNVLKIHQMFICFWLDIFNREENEYGFLWLTITRN